MSAWTRLGRELRFLRGFTRTLWRLRNIEPQSATLACDDLEAAVDAHKSRIAIVSETRSLTYAQFDEVANRYAHWAIGRGIRRGDVVALLMPNRAEYAAIWFGLSKVGVITALINNQLSGASLVHSLSVSGAAHIITDAETSGAFGAIRDGLAKTMTEWTLGAGQAAERDLDQTLRGISALRPTRQSARAGMTAKDVMLYIYTSGTTGSPKAAKVTHMKVQLYMRGLFAGADVKPSDRIYMALPLHHSTGGLCAVGGALLAGGTLVLRRRFSATQFWQDVVDEECTMFAYVGELCRYLVNQAPQPVESEHRLRCAFGNGLRADVAEKMDQRFKIASVLEFYGSTEGNVSIMNFDGKVGAVGRVPPYLRALFNVRVVRFDAERAEPERNASGRLIECAPGETGEAVGKISSRSRTVFAGYSDRRETERKILKDGFEPGDAWFRTGDLLRTDSEGYFYFVDRIGDTYRWKGENVSTSEVEACVSALSGVLEANVYGVVVPHTEGRAGMAALVVAEGFDLKALQAGVDAGLPPYARPVFLRLQAQVQTTATFKHRKLEAAAEGFDPGKINDALYYRTAEQGYARLYAATFERIVAGEIRL